MQNTIKLGLAALVSINIAACSDSSDNGAATPPEAVPTFSAELRRTEYGIPHIKADNWGSLGYGYGYAYSQDNFCVTMREVAQASGRWAELTGDGVDRDQLWRFINGSKEEFRTNFYDKLPQRDQDLITGYAAGMNRYLEETGEENLPNGENGCRGEPWVYRFDEIELMMYLRKIALQASTDQSIVRGAILDVNGPDAEQVASADQLGVRPNLLADLQGMGRTIRPTEVGSNAIAGRWQYGGTRTYIL